MTGRIRPRETRLESEGASSTGYERLVFFSDAVFAIAVTLLAIDLRLPEDVRYLSNGELLSGLADLWPKYLSFLISFYIISRYWASHHRIFRSIHRYDEGLITLNTLFLLFVVVVPFPTTVLGRYTEYTAAIVFHGAALFCPGMMLFILWMYATGKQRCADLHEDVRVARAHRARMAIRLGVPPAVFAASIGVSFVNHIVAVSLWVLVGPLLFVLGRVLRTGGQP